MQPARLLLFPAALLLSGMTAAQQVRALVEVGDEIFGIGTVTGVQNFTVSDSGEWFVTVKFQSGLTTEYALLRNGIPTLQYGDTLASPSGATVLDIDLPSVNRDHDFAAILEFDGYPTTQDTGCFFNSIALLQEGVNSQAPEFSPNTKWSSFINARLNDNRQILCQGTVEDSSISGTGDAAIVLVTIDDMGQLVSEHVLLKEGKSYDGLSPVSAFGTKSHSIAFNRHGDVLTFVDTTDSAATDGNIFLNETSIAREGSPSPAPGRNWAVLSSTRLDLNDFGGHAYAGVLSGDSGTNQLLVKSGEKFMQKGDIIAGVAPYSASNFFAATLQLTNADKMVWYGQFSLSDTSQNKAIFLNEEPIVRIGVTPIGSHYLQILRSVEGAFFVPPDGRYLQFWGKLTNGTIGIYMVDLGAVVRMEECSGNTGTLVNSDGLPMLGERLEFEMDEGQGLGVLPVFLLSTLPVPGWPPCGVDLGIIGELLIDVAADRGNPAYFDFGLPWTGIPSRITVDIPNEPALAGAEFYVQGMFWDVGDQLEAQNLLLTSGLKVMLSAQ